MLDLSCDYVLFFITIKTSQPLYYRIIGLSCPRGEKYLSFIASYQVCYLLPRFLDCLRSVPAELMCFGVRVTIVLKKVWVHGILDSEI